MTFRALRRIVAWLAPAAAVVIILAILRGAGVPLSLPGIVIVVGLLAATRLMMGRSRRRRRERRVTRPDRSR